MSSYANAILSILKERGGHYTAEQLFLLLKQNHPKLVLATVYNNLKSLCEEQTIRKITLENQADRYERNVRHDHLVCRKCGELTDITLSDLTESLRRQTELEDFTYDLKINYVCKQCKAETVQSEFGGALKTPFENKQEGDW